MESARQKAAAWSTKARTDRRIASIVAVGLALVPVLAQAQVSVQKPAQAFFQALSLGFGTIAALAIVFCCVAGLFGMAQWTKLLNIMGWTVAGGGGLSLAAWGVSLAV